MLQIIRKGLEVQGLPETTISIIIASWRPSTRRQYWCSIKKWLSFCTKRETDPLQTTVNLVLIFLTELFDKGASYSSLNCARSALSSFTVLPAGSIGGPDSLISRFMKGVFNLRPAKPRYNEIWDVKPVFNFLRSLSPVRTLSLKQLTLKLCGLLALLTAQRVQTLHKLRLDNMEKKNDIFIFKIEDHIKQSRPGNMGARVELQAYPPDRRLCIKTVLTEYLDRTRPLRKNEKQLLLCFKAPHRATSKDSISRWIRLVLSLSNIDVSKFRSHSTRAAAVSAASAKYVPVSDIMKTAGWSSEKTFQKFYNKPVVKENKFASAVLNAA